MDDTHDELQVGGGEPPAAGRPGGRWAGVAGAATASALALVLGLTTFGSGLHGGRPALAAQPAIVAPPATYATTATGGPSSPPVATPSPAPTASPSPSPEPARTAPPTPSAAPRPDGVVVTRGSAPITLHSGTSVVIELPAYSQSWGWNAPASSDGGVLAPVSATTRPDGSASATFRARRPGVAYIRYQGADRVPDCASAPESAPPGTPRTCASSITVGSVEVTVVR